MSSLNDGPYPDLLGLQRPSCSFPEMSGSIPLTGKILGGQSTAWKLLPPPRCACLRACHGRVAQG